MVRIFPSHASALVASASDDPPLTDTPNVTATLIGYTRCSTDKQDLTAQRQALAELGVASDRIYMDKGLAGLDQVMAAVRKGDTLVVPKLDRIGEGRLGQGVRH